MKTEDDLDYEENQGRKYLRFDLIVTWIMLNIFGAVVAYLISR